MSIIVNILVFLLSLGVVIMIHELGHFFAAKKAGIMRHEFSIGMGPILWKKRKGETLYTIRAIPIGGYVMMAGEEIDDEIIKIGATIRLAFDIHNKVEKIILDHTKEEYENYEKVIVENVDLKGRDMAKLYINDYEVNRDAFLVFKNREMQLAPHERSFDGKTVWQRFLAIFAGPLMNFVLAFIVFLIINLVVGFPNMESSVLGSVGDTFPAGGVLEEGDKVVSIEGNDVNTWDDLSQLLDENPGDRLVTFEVLRDGNTLTLELTPMIFFYGIGFHSSEDYIHETIIGEIVENTKAESAGFLEGDQIIKINGENTNTWTAVIDEIDQVSDGEEMTFVVLRNGVDEETIIVSPYKDSFLESQGIDPIETLVGIGPEHTFNFGKSFVYGMVDVKQSASIIFTTIGLLFDNEGAGEGVGVDDLAGPLGIFQITSRAFEAGFISFLSWIGLLSVNLAIINLLPIPALDGGRLVFLGYEAITRKKPNKKIENTLHYIMYLALMGLFVFITFNDLLRLLNIK